MLTLASSLFKISSNFQYAFFPVLLRIPIPPYRCCPDVAMLPTAALDVGFDFHEPPTDCSGVRSCVCVERTMNPAPVEKSDCFEEFVEEFSFRGCTILGYSILLKVYPCQIIQTNFYQLEIKRNSRWTNHWLSFGWICQGTIIGCTPNSVPMVLIGII